MTQAERASFAAGRVAFIRDRRDDAGFGPLFNGFSCRHCHRIPVVGGSGQSYNRVLHTGFLDGAGTFRQAAGLAGTAVHAFSAGGDGLEQVPAEANVFSRRLPPPLLGLGLVEAIPDETLLALADPQDRDGDGISGRAVRVRGRVARFGQQDQHSSLRALVEHAFAEELGLEAGEVPARHLETVTAFLRFAAPIPPLPAGPDVDGGFRVFQEIGCADCHTPAIVVPRRAFTTSAGEQVSSAALGGLIRPYSDFLLHDMGPELDDGVSLGAGETYEYRTTPLWGHRFRGFKLHDGQAQRHISVLQLHGGEAAASRAAYLALPGRERVALHAFLDSL